MTLDDEQIPSEVVAVDDPVAPVMPSYPDTPVGSLRRQIDTLRRQADSDRGFAAALIEKATLYDEQADSLEAAVNSMESS